jgi:hypothetical protein
VTAGTGQNPACGTSNGDTTIGLGDFLGGYPQGAPDGSLYLLVPCGSTTYLARSTDEAASFPILHKADGSPVTVPGSPTELRVDSAGNLYALGISGTAIQLFDSRDGGNSWSAPLNMTAPSARQASIYQWQVAVGWQPGHLAVSYLVPRASGGYDGYITVTHDAVDARPVFYAQTVNKPGTPLVTKVGAGDDWLDLDMDSDGNAWAAFYSDCDSSVPYCSQTQYIGPEPLGANEATGPQAETIGRLLWSESVDGHP